MANTFIAGYLAELSIDGDALEQVTASGTITRTKNIMTKAVAGTQTPSVLAGVITGTLSVSGHASPAEIILLDAAYEDNSPLVYVFQIGDTTAPDGGAYGGSLLIESLSFAFDADDEWTFSLDAILSGAQTYTAA